MNQTYLLAFLLICISCSDNKSTATEDTTPATVAARTTPFDPMKSEAYKRVFIIPDYKQEKDTFLAGEDLTARISFENLNMLKEVAAHENLLYDINFDAKTFIEDKNLTIVPSEDKSYADVKFKVPSPNSENVEERKWRYETRFVFLENNKNIYDTTFIVDVQYFVKSK
ncbi:hypothetical protein [Cesiribacter sp. SM1]|uniref:hypothetical protein n=1 Tax=Cesiribacter sp. SM1 TaxID=2861196 RepID=UPI001CD1C466|nr:hypothetical protein [Cesiribacter sp. SM1]